jgi:hypothetical protein
LAIAGGSTSAQAQNVNLNVSGTGMSSAVTLTYAANPNTGALGTSPNLHDPVGSYIVTGISGTFSDSNLGLVNVPITGIVQSQPSSPQPTNLLAPHSFGFYPVGAGLPSPEGLAPGLSYDDLYYPGGSPQTASSYPFHGGFFDIYGLVFTLEGGDAVNLWSNGDMGRGVTYGAGVTDGAVLLDKVSGLSVTAVPEPTTWAMLLLGLGMIGIAARAKRARLQPA